MQNAKCTMQNVAGKPPLPKGGRATKWRGILLSVKLKVNRNSVGATLCGRPQKRIPGGQAPSDEGAVAALP